MCNYPLFHFQSISPRILTFKKCYIKLTKMYIIRGFGDTAHIIVAANKYIIIEKRSKKYYFFLRIGPVAISNKTI